jgi:hypothetical protein
MKQMQTDINRGTENRRGNQGKRKKVSSKTNMAGTG